MTSVARSGAVSLVACDRNGARVEVIVLAYLRYRLPVQAPSSAVSCCPSDHLPGLSLNVHVRPSFDVVQLFAQSPSNLNFALYCTSVGYVFVKTMYGRALNATNGL